MGSYTPQSPFAICVRIALDSSVQTCFAPLALELSCVMVQYREPEITV